MTATNARAGTTELTIDQAYTRLCQDLPAPAGTQSLALRAARGRVLAQALVAAHDLPGQDVSAMDGYVVRATDLAHGAQVLPVAGSILAGHGLAQALPPGQCARIMTGAPLPPGGNAVVVLEQAQALADGRVLLPGPVAPGANCRPRGEHVRQGDPVLPAGRRLRAADLALAAALGCATVMVYRQLRVGVFSTGDELHDAPASLPAAGAYDSNRPLLLAALDAAAIDAIDLGICRDDPAALQQLIERAWDLGLDALLASGGAAQGDADLVRALGGVEFLALAVRPGRGIVHGWLRRGSAALLLLGLPGNAVAAYVLAHLLALPLLSRLAGAAAAAPPRPIALAAARELHTRAGRIELRRARLIFDAAGNCSVDPLAEQGSAMLRSVCAAQAIVAVGPSAHYRAGELLPTYLLSAFEDPHQPE